MSISNFFFFRLEKILKINMQTFEEQTKTYTHTHLHSYVYINILINKFNYMLIKIIFIYS